MKKEIVIKLSLIIAITMQLSITMIFGQENKPVKSIQVYSNFNYYSPLKKLEPLASSLYTSNTTSETAKFGYFTPSITIYKKNGNSHEIELSKIDFLYDDFETDLTGDNYYSVVSGEKTMSLHLAFRYEYNIRLLKSKEKAKLVPNIGLSVSPYFSRSINNPLISTHYPTSNTNTGAFVSIIPRARYYFKENWFFDVNIPFILFDIKLDISDVENPTLPERFRKITSIILSEFPRPLAFRIGVGLKF